MSNHVPRIGHRVSSFLKCFRLLFPPPVPAYRPPKLWRRPQHGELCRVFELSVKSGDCPDAVLTHQLCRRAVGETKLCTLLFSESTPGRLENVVADSEHSK